MIRRPAASGLTQWGVLTQRTLETFVRNRLTLAILVGSPALVVGMFAVLFRPGAFDFQDPSPSSMVMIGFWVVFAAFFFGLTYGLLQICTERTILRRERFVGLRLGAYVASKVTILVPFLLLVVVAMLGVLRLLDRLPSRPLSTYASMGFGLLLCAVAALGLGLLTSAMVGNVAQATLALPMLCFPAVLFSGAILPVNLMARPAPPSASGSHRAGPSKRSVTTSGRGGSSLTAARRSGRRCSPRTATRARSPPAPTGSCSARSLSCSWSPHGVCSCGQHGENGTLNSAASGSPCWRYRSPGAPDATSLAVHASATDHPDSTAPAKQRQQIDLSPSRGDFTLSMQVQQITRSRQHLRRYANRSTWRPRRYARTSDVTKVHVAGLNIE